MHLVLFPILGLFTIMSIVWNLRNKKNNFPTNRPIPEKQVRVRGNKNIFKVGLIGDISPQLLKNSCQWQKNVH